MSRARHFVLQSLAAAILLGAILCVAAVLVVRSGWFRERVRERIVQEIETATGGRVEIANFSFDWRGLTATIAPLILHGKEASTEAPLARLGSVTVGLKIISALERRVDLASLRIDKPSIHLIVYPDGTTNLPTPREPGGDGNWAKGLIDLAVRHYEIASGTLELDQRKIPLNLRGDDLHLVMDYQAAIRNGTAGAHYDGRLSARQVQLLAGAAIPIIGGVDALFRLDAAQAQFTRLHLTTALSRADLKGSLTDLRAPRGKFSISASVNAADIVPLVAPGTPITGRAAFNGTLAVSFADGFDYDITGHADARDVSYRDGRVSIVGGSAAGTFKAAPKQLSFRNVTGEALGTNFTAEASLESNGKNNGKFHLEGGYDNAGIRTVLAMLTDQPIAWNGVASGTFGVEADVKKKTSLSKVSAAIAPVAGDGIPVTGQVDLTYDQQAGTVRFGDSRLETAATSVDFNGTLGQTLTVKAKSTNLDDVLPALVLVSNDAPKRLPVKLDGGDASIDGTVTGALDQPQFRGQVSAAKVSLATGSQSQPPAWFRIDRFSGLISASRHAITVDHLTLTHGGTAISGGAGISSNGSSNNTDLAHGSLAGRLNVVHLEIAEAIKESGLGAKVSGGAAGVASGSLQLSGTLQHPEAESTFEAVKLSAYEQNADRLRATVRYSSKEIEIRNGEADVGPGRVQFAGVFTHPENDFANGNLHLESSLQGLPAHLITALHKLQPDDDGVLDGKATLDAVLDKGAISVRSLNGNAAARAIMFRGSPLGEVAFTAVSTGQQLAVQASGKLRDATVTGKGQWSLQGDNPGEATIQFPRITVDTLHDLAVLGSPPGNTVAPPPFLGFLTGGATVKVSLQEPQNFQTDLTINTLELRPRASNEINANLQRLNLQAQDIQLRNTQPIVIDLNSKEARIRSAHFSARDTDLEVTGLLPFTTAGGADLNVKGTVNLGILQLLNANLLARGSAVVTASVRGSLQEPALNGRMQLTNASLYLTDVPNGVERANGVILFDRNRATIERLTAETGGGQIALKGSVEFGGELVYRLQAEAQQVRVRYPEDVSITATAQLALNGTSTASTLSGTLTLNRAGITQGADIGRVLAATSQPSGAPADDNDYLRGMRFDIHIESAPTFQMDTSLTRNVQSEVDLHLRGTPAAPALLGTISASSGDVQMFGNRYTVNRGDIRFVNPIKIDPILDLDLETRSRGIVVNVTITGSPQKLNVNYSSDPPLQSREIIALLASGRDPTVLTQDSQIGTATSATGLGDAGGLLSEAFSEQLSNRLQRFFGSSRVKIDPQITGVDTLPSARLTLEQQVSRDVTLTYTTNLNRTQEQVVRLEWEFTQTWSAVAVRDANGFFGIDFQYRKRFK